MPELKGKVDGISVRAPVPTGSITDLVVAARPRGDRRRDQRARSGRPPTGRSRGSSSTPTDPLVSTDIERLAVLVHPRQRADDGERHASPRCSAGTTTSGATRAGSSIWCEGRAGLKSRSAKAAALGRRRRRRRQARPRPRRPQRSARGRRASPTTRGSARRCRRPAPARPRRGESPCARISGGRRPRRTGGVLHGAGGATRSASWSPTSASTSSRTRASTRGETKNDPGFARELDEGGTSMSTTRSARRTRVLSTEAVAHLLPAYAGLLLLESSRTSAACSVTSSVPSSSSPAARRSRTSSASSSTSAAARTPSSSAARWPKSYATKPACRSRSSSRRRRRGARRSRPTPRAVSCRTTRSGRLARPRHRPETRERFGGLAPRGRCSGTGRWASSSGRASPRAQGGRARQSRTTTATPSSAAATRCARVQELGLADRISWVSTGGGAPRAARGQGAARRCAIPEEEMTKLVAGNWKMFKGPSRDAHVLRPLRGAGGRRGRRLPAVTFARGRSRRGMDHYAQTSTGRRRRVHR